MSPQTASRCALALLAFAWTCAVPAQERIRFGEPVTAGRDAALADLLALSTEPPPRALGEGAEVVLVSGYEPASAGAGNQVAVMVDRPGAKVLLVLTSYEKVTWRVEATPGTMVTGLLVAGYHEPAVATGLSVPGYRVKLPYAYETENINFARLLAALREGFGAERVDVFRGSYRIPPVVRIATLDPRRPELATSGIAPRKPDRNFGFDLVTADLRRVPWTLAGPADVEGAVSEGAVHVNGKMALSPTGRTLYRLSEKGLEVVDAATGEGAVVPLPANFPRFSWAMDLAYDTRRDLVAVVSLGGEGFLYRFDARKGQWLDFRSLNNTDIFSLAYDPRADRYVAWADQGMVILISGEGQALYARSIGDGLPGFGRTYDRNNGRTPRLAVAPQGDDLALVHMDGGAVTHVWHYDLATERGTLTYRRGAAPADLAPRKARSPSRRE